MGSPQHLSFADAFAVSTGVVGLLAWVANNLAPSWRKSIGIAFVACLANLGGSIGSNIYLEEQQPRYWLGYGLSLGVLTAAIAACVLLKVFLGRVNKSRDRMDVDEVKRMWTEELGLVRQHPAIHPPTVYPL